MHESLPTRLRILRAERGLGLREAAELCGMTKETLSDLERGIRTGRDTTLAKIAKGYGVPLRDLIGELDAPLVEAPTPRPASVPAADARVEVRRMTGPDGLPDPTEALAKRVEAARAKVRTAARTGGSATSKVKLAQGLDQDLELLHDAQNAVLDDYRAVVAEAYQAAVQAVYEEDEAGVIDLSAEPVDVDVLRERQQELAG